MLIYHVKLKQLSETFAQTLTGRILEESIMSVKISSYEIDLTTIAKESVEEFTMSMILKQHLMV